MLVKWQWLITKSESINNKYDSFHIQCSDIFNPKFTIYENDYEPKIRTGILTSYGIYALK